MDVQVKRLQSKRSRTSSDFVALNLESEAVLGGFSQSEIRETDTYEIASHSVRVRKSGTVLDVHSLWDIEHSGFFGKKPSVTRSSAFGSSAVRLKSIFNFNQNGQAKEMLNGLKYFEKTVTSKDNSTVIIKLPFTWGEVDRSALGACLITICGLVKDILINEPRLLELSSPVYILGDIHGNFPDLLCFEKALWRLGPVLTPATFLFLGDYVDRGEFGVEVVSYLFAHKLTAPSKFNLLRGNHEIRDVQQMFTFYKECLTKFGDKLGREIWNAVNDVFDVMPLAAVIDKKIFCAHGGIPPPWIGSGAVEIIKSIPSPLPKPEEQSKLAWELMWSDPLHCENITAEQKAQYALVDGFGENIRRGTAHVFTEDALDSFLKKNGLSHVVRAHEVQQAGFQVQLGGRLLTVFSSSKYCGGSNEAACILADKLKLRTIRLDTS
ncbi:Serine/threonine-protein phosphatase PP1 isozyme 5 [Orchesella cincta]|uniref:Serine/threonine-protein phosphatase n=1 Tax=Orchesella cincta TaxID=48709 RepID=A0A1D2N6G8_ORCCI|nr:Serine/threonine-protein phosphatase PP1 isozyme 5 [Orchesella cincta]